MNPEERVAGAAILVDELILGHRGSVREILTNHSEPVQMVLAMLRVQAQRGENLLLEVVNLQSLLEGINV